ncbi:hypothetical protein F8388_022654 [Cannabis sativa]|uniref:Uncharacterized protein n=1 Tax=Cannabis sativa TaxID=3483 RepID=A0A7J6G236_CANSA|nr:hypothetical protein F8388_022654 [Cannabis sativa]
MGLLHGIILLHLALTAAGIINLRRAEAKTPDDRCPRYCGNVEIRYPFGIGGSCYLNSKFNITCNDSIDPPKTYLGKGNLQVRNISIIDGEIRVLQLIAKDCYYKNGSQHQNDRLRSRLRLSSFTVSSTKNKFTAIGCNTFAIIQGFQGEQRYRTGCMSFCDQARDINYYGTCSGVGCCQVMSIPPRLNNFTVSLSSINSSNTKVLDSNPCSYGILAEESEFKFSNTSFQEFQSKKNFPLVVDWSIGELPCEKARKFKNFTCHLETSECVNSNSSNGYLCRCLPGFIGNPYHPKGCQDIDECKGENPCINGNCINVNGSFKCSCLKGYKRVNESETTCGLLSLIAISIMLYWGVRKRKLIMLKEKFFEQNGGLMLQQKLSSTEKGPVETTKIFTAKELEMATDNYHESRIIGEGGYGIVYKGIFPNNKVVAIKKSKFGAQIVPAEQIEQFINEVILLMQINHRNVVRLLGCCLETEVPLLVYEFITNGTLFQHIHNKGNEPCSSLSWEMRLKIATETAGALAYLHCETNTPIVHRDIKTMNILLDENFIAKVSDFGTSRLIPIDEDQLSTLVQGTVGYLDPEYLQTSQLTEKSDVYSFGVVLGELITGKRAFSFDKLNNVSQVLAMSLLSVKDNDQFNEFIDDKIFNDGNMEVIKEVVALTKRCLRIKGEDRPTMKEVAMELEGLRAMSKHSWTNVGDEESEHLLGEKHSINHNNYIGYDLECGSSGTTAMYDSMQTQLMLNPFDDGR